MVTILLKILGIIGISLLVILGLLLLIILAVLFVPVVYRIKVDKKTDLHASVRASWLLGMVRMVYLYPDPGNAIIKVLFFKIYDSGADKIDSHDSRAKTGKLKKHKKSEKSEYTETEKETEKSGRSDDCRENAKDTGPHSGESAQGAAQQGTTGQDENRQSTGQHGAEKQSETQKQNPIEKLQYTFRDICDKIKDVRDNINYYKDVLSREDTKDYLNQGYIRLGKILRSIRPRKLKADIRFGTGSPDTTGYAYAVYGILCPYLGRKVLVVPDFEQAVLEGEFYAAGHITLFTILWHVMIIILDKRFKELMSKLKQED